MINFPPIITAPPISYLMRKDVQKDETSIDPPVSAPKIQGCSITDLAVAIDPCSGLKLNRLA